MASPTGSLLWKEWREQRWKLAFCCVMLGAFTAIGLRTRVVSDMVVVSVGFAIGATIVPLLVAMGLVAPERDEGSLECLHALPVSSWIVLTVKMAVGAAACLAPLVVAAAIACVVAGGREETMPRILLAYAASGCVGLCAFVWFVAFGMRQPTEGRAALAGMAVLVLWVVAALIYPQVLEHTIADSIWVLHPFGLFAFFIDSGERYSGGQLAGAISAQLVQLSLLFLWAGCRFRKPGRARA